MSMFVTVTGTRHPPLTRTSISIIIIRNSHKQKYIAPIVFCFWSIVFFWSGKKVWFMQYILDIHIHIHCVMDFKYRIHTCIIALTLYSQKGSRGISDIHPRNPCFTKKTLLWEIPQMWQGVSHRLIVKFRNVNLK
jgi:hypothetical protein